MGVLTKSDKRFDYDLVGLRAATGEIAWRQPLPPLTGIEWDNQRLPMMVVPLDHGDRAWIHRGSAWLLPASGAAPTQLATAAFWLDADRDYSPSPEPPPVDGQAVTFHSVGLVSEQWPSQTPANETPTRIGPDVGADLGSVRVVAIPAGFTGLTG